MGLNALIVMFLAYFFSQLIPLIFLAMLSAQDHGHFTTLGIVAIVCYSLSFVWLFQPLVLFLPYVGAILITIDRIHQNEFNAITKVYVALVFGGLLPGSLYAIVWDVTLRNYAYKAWLATFEEDWDTNGKYKTWWWIFGLNVRLMGVIEAAEGWIFHRKQVTYRE